MKPDCPAETFWERFLATYRFRRNFGRGSAAWCSTWAICEYATPRWIRKFETSNGD
jgi:hypothetical protein